MMTASTKEHFWIIFSYFLLLVFVNSKISAETCKSTICKPITDSHTCHNEEAECTIICAAGFYNIPTSWKKIWCELTDNSNLTNVHVVFQNNQLFQVSQLAPLPALTKLSFEYNYIKNLTEFAFANLIHLKSLSIIGNSQLMFTSINNNAFSGNNNSNLPLEVLDLSSNALRTLPEGIFRNTPNITELNLFDNDIQVLDNSTVAAINALNNLKKLNLSKNGLRKLPKALEPSIRRIITLDLSNNKFEMVPDILEYSSQLLHLDLSYNSMPVFNPMSFIGLENLQILNISNEQDLNFIYSGAFSPLKNLKLLVCNNNDNLNEVPLKSFRSSYGEGPNSTIKIELCNNNLLTSISNIQAMGGENNCTYIVDFSATNIKLLLNEATPSQMTEARQPTFTVTYMLMSVGLTACFLLIITISIIIIRKNKTYSTLPLTSNTSSVYSSVDLDDDT